MQTAGYRGASRKALIVELVGLAGAGKTTISRALTQYGTSFQVGDDLELRKIKHIPIFFTATFSSLPVLVGRCGPGRWFTWNEIKAVAYLKGWSDFLTRQAARKGVTTLLDHGPAFKLATLDAFGPERLKSGCFDRWWEASFQRWAFTLDMMIWLDAPDSILVERILRRSQRHAIKGKSEAEAQDFLGRYRRSYEEVLGKLIAYRAPTVLRFDTARASVEQIVDEVRARCNLKLTERASLEEREFG